MRQPLVTMMSMASALIQCVMRTISGWMLTQRASSIEVPRAAVPTWSETIAYTLQRPAAVSFAEAIERGGEPSRQGDHLEQLAHFGGVHEPVRLVREREEFRPVLGRGARHHVGDAAVDQELRLAGVSDELQAARAGGRRHRAEVDMAGDVLQPGEKEGIGMRVVAIVAHERAFPALRVVILLLRKAIVDEERHTLLEHSGERAKEPAGRDR